MEKTRKIKDLLWVLACAGAVAGVLRMGFGLGATTNLTDGVPWGLWKILNMVGGVAVSTGGFTVGFLVYVLKLERFRPLMKPAILVAFLGYGSSLFALLFDIGLPHRFWHPIVMWNENSFLFEVFWCVLLYFNICLIEVLPPIMKRYGFERVEKFLHRSAFGVVVVGISLSSLHHSSLGSLFLVTPQRLHPLWYTPLLPVLFILSAMGAGMMTVVLAKMLYARYYAPETVYGEPQAACDIETIKGKVQTVSVSRSAGPDLPMLSRLAVIAAWILGITFVIKVADLFMTGAWRVLLQGTWESWLLGFELALTAVFPVTLMAIPSMRKSPVGVGTAALSAFAGILLNRMDVGIFGYFRDAGTIYFPSLIEWAVCLGVVAGGGLVFFFVVENFAIFDDRWHERKLFLTRFKSSFDSLSHVWNIALQSGVHRITLIAVVIVPLAWITMYPPYFSSFGVPKHEPVQPAMGVDILRAKLMLDGNRGGVSTEFPHVDHQKRLGGEKSCSRCHHMSMPGDRSTPCSRCHRDMIHGVSIFDHLGHQAAVAKKERLAGVHPANNSCSVCHGLEGAKTGARAKTCLECHQKDMGLPADYDGNPRFQPAISFMEAMHKNCIDCHREEAKKREDKKGLGECYTCHPSLRSRVIVPAMDVARMRP